MMTDACRELVPAEESVRIWHASNRKDAEVMFDAPLLHMTEIISQHKLDVDQVKIPV